MTDCARCGDCCDPVVLGNDAIETIWGGRKGYPDWTEWYRANLTFHHWTVDGAAFTCTNFDPGTRSCTAYDGRPQMCTGYPWYGKDPQLRPGLSPRCSFIVDVPGVVMLPIVDVTHRAAA